MYGSENRSEIDSKGLVSQHFERSILRGAGVNLLCADAGRGGHDSADNGGGLLRRTLAAWEYFAPEGDTPLSPIGDMGIQL